MRRLSAVLVLTALALAGVAWANGITGSDAPSRIPVPAQIHAATVYDRTGAAVDVTRVTFNGEVFLYGTVGEGTATVPFERLAEARVEPTDDPKKRVVFGVLRDGTNVRLVVDDDLPCYGETSYGYYKIEVGKVARIVFRGAVPRP
ncbi:MAG: hypothetical protein KC656_36110 [Myxococcales bacterium]|nr:hypothetical protein [Myxococcales bacterium]MCB9664376.1 hypothetical protein [Alphaproteobacteria bacterium]